MRIKPKEGLIVRNPVNGLIVPEKGLNVPNNSYWRRRVKDGSVDIMKESPNPKPTPKPRPKPEVKPESKKSESEKTDN